MNSAPAGFQVMPPYGIFGEMLGPMYWKEAQGGITAGLLVEPKHCGLTPFLHGGMLAVLIDTAFTWATRRLYDPASAVVTTNLCVDFLASATPGDWVEARVDVVRSGKRLSFLSCFVWKGEERIARANAQFQVIDRAKRPLPGQS